MAKWASRFVLGLSNSVPGIDIEPANIVLVDDIGDQRPLREICRLIISSCE